MGATSVQYKKLGPNSPIGKKKLKRKRKNASATEAAWFLLEKLEVMAIDVMHSVMPAPQNRNNFLRPKRSMVKNETNDARNFQVKALAPRMRDRGPDNPRFSRKMVVEYVLMTLAPVIWIQNCIPRHSINLVYRRA